MAINFPTSLDVFSNPTGTDLLENATAALDHDVQHSNANDAIEALEAKVGANSSAVTTSHDYKLSAVTGSAKALTSGTSTQSVTNLTLVTPTLTLTSDATGDIYYRNSGGSLTRLPIGTAGQILDVSAGGIPEWIANPAVSDASTTAKGVVEEATLAETLARTAAGATSARLFVNPTNVVSNFNYDYVADTGTGAAYAIAPTPAVTAYVTGQKYTFKAVNANTTTTPTLAVSGLASPKTIVNSNSKPLLVGQLVANGIYTVVYDGTNMVLESDSNDKSILVGTGTDATFQTSQLNMIPISTTVMPGWTLTGGTFNLTSGSNYVNIDSNATCSAFGSIASSTAGSINFDVASGKALRLKFRAIMSDTTDIKGMGFTTSIGSASSYAAHTDTTNGTIRFLWSSTTLYAHNANGTATYTDISSGITATNWNTYEIVFNPGVNILFYVNGSLKATHTTNLPTTGANYGVCFGLSSATPSLWVTPPILSIQN